MIRESKKSGSFNKVGSSKIKARTACTCGFPVLINCAAVNTESAIPVAAGATPLALGKTGALVDPLGRTGTAALGRTETGAVTLGKAGVKTPGRREARALGKTAAKVLGRARMKVPGKREAGALIPVEASGRIPVACLAVLPKARGDMVKEGSPIDRSVMERGFIIERV
ncbi:MAG: hypothetical protein AB1847_00870 [bacterium]